MILAVEHFNRPFDHGRVCATLILLDCRFEMLLKSAMLKRGGRIREPGASTTIGFDACVKQGLSNGAIKFLDADQAVVLRTFNGWRDAAHHHLLDISEDQLYVQTQAGVTLFGDLLKSVFRMGLRSVLPSRVMPISTRAPNDIPIMLADEMEEIRRLLKPGRRQRVQARCRGRVGGRDPQGRHVELLLAGAPSTRQTACTHRTEDDRTYSMSETSGRP